MLINWLRNRLWNRQRLLFRYHDGRRIRRIDPVAAAISLHAHPKYVHRHLGEAVDGNEASLQIVSQAATDVFGIPPLTPDGKKGLTHMERLEVMLGFDQFLQALKKNTVPTVTSPSSTESTSPTSSEPTMSDMSLSS